ncbi:transcriptional regulator [Streptomyces netropsis]|uniref:Uncharacterized protein n=1 Tax=Streptomyces netropsis TaxID=55404 RepID=A0A7W7LF81_STRNE|nr:transcriptional regulator [Streptomyces netropsis]MBB4889090.1 hypothetical protein [Streptomyces netropsis]GGR08043.1 hypothetical protein GCM10010219_10320 [Streptomyces netropsis]
MTAGAAEAAGTTPVRPAVEDDPLARLAGEGATGALHGPVGALYLSDGAVVHAESPAAPDVGWRLTARGRLSPETWEEAVTQGGPGYRTGDFLVEHGRLSQGELELCHLSALFDAAYFVLYPLGDGQRPPERFLREARHWLGPVRPVTVPALQREVRRRRRLLEQAWPGAAVDAAPVVPVPDADRRRGRGAQAVCGRRAVLRAADGVRTPVQIARALGRPAFATLLDVRRLTALGLIRPPDPGTTEADRPLPEAPGVPETSLLIRIRDALEAL